MAVHRPCNRIVAAKARIERRMVERALRVTDSNVSMAARLLGCDRPGLHKLIKLHAVSYSPRPVRRGNWRSLEH